MLQYNLASLLYKTIGNVLSFAELKSFPRMIFLVYTPSFLSMKVTKKAGEEWKLPSPHALCNIHHYLWYGTGITLFLLPHKMQGGTRESETMMKKEKIRTPNQKQSSCPFYNHLLSQNNCKQIVGRINFSSCHLLPFILSGKT